MKSQGLRRSGGYDASVKDRAAIAVQGVESVVVAVDLISASRAAQARGGYLDEKTGLLSRGTGLEMPQVCIPVVWVVGVTRFRNE